jgi:16S rRNA (uracil1498-N3)-methyltransferase
MADRFFTPERLPPGPLVLQGDEAHHLANVRRFQPGERITLFNGDGCDYPAQVLHVQKKAVTVEVFSALPVNREVGFPLVVASALPKGDRADYLIEKLVEVGVTRFVPLITARSVVHPKESKGEKFQRAVIEASKQCGRNVLMTVDPPQKWTAFLQRLDLPALRYVLHTSATDTALSVARNPAGVVLAVGSEGGFSPEEVMQAEGWSVLSLGPRVLRIETAAVVAAARFSHG